MYSVTSLVLPVGGHGLTGTQEDFVAAGWTNSSPNVPAESDYNDHDDNDDNRDSYGAPTLALVSTRARGDWIDAFAHSSDNRPRKNRVANPVGSTSTFTA